VQNLVTVRLHVSPPNTLYGCLLVLSKNVSVHI